MALYLFNRKRRTVPSMASLDPIQPDKALRSRTCFTFVVSQTTHKPGFKCKRALKAARALPALPTCRLPKRLTS
jgi:hypothetical protein